MHASKSSIHPDTPILVLKSIFQRYDADRDGFLNEIEFGNALEDLGISDEDEQCALFALADSNNSKTVQLEDFIKLIKSNDFEMILSSREDYEFVIQTYKAFQQYDANGDGSITWDEFYFYLTKHGYSHQYISQYWYYMDTERKLCVSFEGFWRGFKFQANAIKQHQLQQVLNKEISNENEVKKAKKRSKKKSLRKRIRKKRKARARGRTLDKLAGYRDEDDQNVFEFLKSHLKPTKQNKSQSKLKLGRVIEKDEDITDEDGSVPLPISTDLKQSRASRLPDIIMNVGTPLHAILPSFSYRRKKQSAISVLSPTMALNTNKNIPLLNANVSALCAVEQSESHISFSDFCCDISPSYTSGCSLASTPKLTPNYSNDVKSPYSNITNNNDDSVDYEENSFSDFSRKKRQKHKKRKKKGKIKKVKSRKKAVAI